MIARIRKKWRRLKSIGGFDARIESLEQSQKKIECLQRELQLLRSEARVGKAQPLHIVFVCHLPAAWGKLSPLYEVLLKNPAFKTTLVCVPYRHSSFGDREFHDGGMETRLIEQGFEYISGYNREKKEWLDLQDLAPDYVFFQTPYDHQFPYEYTSECVSAYARVCYVPYLGILIFKGEVEEITHPLSFFKNLSLVLVGNSDERNDLLKRFHGVLKTNQVVVTGSPMLDAILHTDSPNSCAWNKERSECTKRILWTPRWRTEEGNCHFFDYKDYFFNLAGGNENVDYLFRPHPLCLQNFASTGELPQADQDKMLEEFDRLPNAKIDSSGDYRDTFLTSDILVSDMSSMMAEYFITGKPIIYSHRVDHFNEFGTKLAQGYYWVRNQTELDETLKMLLRGEDPLRETRIKIIEKMFFLPEEGASAQISKELEKQFLNHRDSPISVPI